MKQRYLLILFVCLLVFPSLLEAGDTVNKRFVYYIYWSGIKAGEAVLDYSSTPDGITIRTHATSAPVVSLFYPVDDIAESTLYPDGYPKKFTLKVRKGLYKRDKVTYFERKTDGKPQKIIYHNSLDNKTLEFFLDRQAYDPLSAFYEMTKWDLKIGQSAFIDIFDSKKLFNTEVQVLKKERVTVPAGEFNTIVVRPIIKSEGIFRKTGDITIWATDDDRKLPVLLKSRAIIGHFSAELVEGQ
ncbi:MAG: DUF3108 domain-containing protein [Nitrospirae bacterium]|nr:DUF3108 domain-containing protein [Nitrospirota bacterium]